MRWFRRLTSGRASQSDETVVTFTGGMGAQILSAAIYWHLQAQGRKVWADLSYFDQPEHLATVGNKGDCSHWAWQLDGFGVQKTDFLWAPHLTRKNSHWIEDGEEKLRVAIDALANADIRDRFSLVSIPQTIEEFQVGKEYICLHIRRGDYVNVASHLVSNEEFVKIARQFSGLIPALVVVSDSPIENTLREQLAELYPHSHFMDKVDPLTSHYIMRSARILVCSNSQFSLVAALLNKAALVVIPKKWFGVSHASLEIPIHNRCNFQVISH